MPGQPRRGEPGAAPTLFVNRLSRLVVDPEWFADEREEILQIGMGIVYTRGFAGRQLRVEDYSCRIGRQKWWLSPRAVELRFSGLVDVFAIWAEPCQFGVLGCEGGSSTSSVDSGELRLGGHVPDVPNPGPFNAHLYAFTSFKRTIWVSIGDMETSVTNLRNHLKTMLDSVRDGADVTITDHGHPVARIVPFHKSKPLQHLIAQGIVSTPSSPKTSITKESARVTPKGSVSDLVSNLRQR